MAIIKITYADKDSDAPLGSLSRMWTADDANQVKDVVNLLSDMVGATGGGKALVQPVQGQSSLQITHGFGTRPLVTVLDAQGYVVSVRVRHIDQDTISVEWGESFTGKVIMAI